MPLTRRVQVYISAEASEALDRLTSRLGTQTAAIEYALTAVDDQVERSNGAATERTPDRIVATGPMIEPEPGRSYEINGRALENSLSPEATAARSEKKAVRAGRKAERMEGVSRVLAQNRAANAEIASKSVFEPEMPDEIQHPLEVVREDTRTAIEFAKRRSLERGRVEPLTKPGKR